MQDLQLIGVHEDGEHLLLSGADDARFRLPVDEALRAALRRDRPHLGQQQVEADGGLRPRDVQALIRAGASSDEAASRAGWTVEKVHRYEGPILAEREHVAGLAQNARLRNRNGVSGGGAPTLSARVAERLKSRDVEVTETSWDSWRSEGGPWTVVLTFAAGGRQRQASWSFDLADRTVSAVDDEARWLSEEVQKAKGPIPAPAHRPSPGRATAVYDVEAEGGLQPAAREEHQDDPLDLMSAMRKRSSARGRRRPGGRNAPSRTGSSAAGSPGAAPAKTAADVPEDDRQDLNPALPLEDLDYGATTVPAAASGQADDPSPTTMERDDGRPGSDAEDGGSATTVASPGRASAIGEGPAGESSAGESSAAEGSAGDRSAGDGSTGDGRTGGPAAGVALSDPGELAQASDQTHGPAERPAPKSRAASKKRPSREAARKNGRPSVPAWDEIMFGSRPDADSSSR